MKDYDSTPSTLTRIKDFISDNITGVIAAVIIAIIVFILGVLLIPVKETMTVKSTWWDWQIPINKFAEVSHTSDYYPRGEGVHDVNAEITYHTKKVVDQKAYTDADGTHHPERSHTEHVPEKRYHYKRDEWVFSYNIPCSGMDKNPHEAECDIPYPSASPELGDLSRGPHVETYGVIGEKADGAGCNYDVSKSDWERIEVGGTITYKYRRIDKKKIYDISLE